MAAALVSASALLCWSPLGYTQGSRVDWSVAPTPANAPQEETIAIGAQALLGGGAVALFGEANNAGTFISLEARRLAEDGSTEWTVNWPASNGVSVRDFAVDPFGQTLVVIGRGSLGSGFDLHMVSADGIEIWTRVIAPGPSAFFRRADLGFAPDGDVVVSLQEATFAGGPLPDPSLVRLLGFEGATGAPQWSQLVPVDGEVRAEVDRQGEVSLIELSASSSPASTLDFRYWRHGADGQPLAATAFSVPANGTSVLGEVQFDVGGEFLAVTTTGGSVGPTLRNVHLSVDQAGALEWSYSISGGTPPWTAILRGGDLLVLRGLDGSERVDRGGVRRQVDLTQFEPAVRPRPYPLRDGGYLLIQASTLGRLYRLTAEDELLWSRLGESLGEVVLPISEGLQGRILVPFYEEFFFFQGRGTVRQFVEEPANSSTTTCVQGTANSTGRAGKLVAFGSTDVQQDDLSLLFYDLPANVALLPLVSRTGGFLANPGGSLGDLCLGGAIGRLPLVGQTTGVGTARARLNLSGLPTPTALVPVVAGETWVFQGWHRDIAGGPVSNLTSAIEVNF